ncbi:MAG TPA: glycosyltransferase family 2 protein [Blastocatellia bacterium]
MKAEVIFISSLLVIAYAYIGYPALIFLISRLRHQPVRKAAITPSVSMIIAAYNEERDIASKLENTLALDYPSDRLEVIVVSDCSTDQTDEIVRSWAERGVILHRQSERHGKTIAQNRAAEIATGEILVFSDATTMYERDALKKVVRNFADPQVGCVGGQLIYADRSKTVVGRGCRSYWGYEKFIRECESRTGSLIGVSGCFYAVSRAVFTPLDRDMTSDFVIASDIYLKGLRTVYEPEAICTEDTNQRSRDEFRMRVRVIEQTLSAMRRYRAVFNLSRHPMFAFQMLSHKLLRYAVALLLIIAFISNAMLVGAATIYQLMFAGQCAFYTAAIVGWMRERAGARPGLLAFPYYFALANAATIAAFIKFARGEAHVVWEPLRDVGSSGRHSG